MPKAAAFESTPEFQRLRTEQDDVLTRAQLRTLGADRHLIGRRHRAGTWRTIGPHVVVLHGGPLSRRQQLWAGVLHAGAGAGLGSWTALEVAGLRRFESPVVHTVVPHGTGRRRLVTEQVQIVVTESRHLDDHDFHPVKTPRRVRPERAAVDAASAATSDASCRAVLAAVVQQRLIPVDRLRTEIARRPNLHRMRLIAETVEDVGGGSHSLPELEWLDAIRRTGLPEPTRQRIVKRPGGRYYLDAEFDPFEVTVEINGAQHLDLILADADDERRSQLSIEGRMVVDISSYTVRHEPDRAMLRTARALYSRGWRPNRTVLGRLRRMAAGRGQRLWPDHMRALGRSA